MKYTTLKTISRQPMGTRSNNRLRKEGAIPGSVLKLDKTSTSLSINRSDFVNLINTQGRSAVFKLAIDKQKPIFTMIRDIEVQSHTDIYLNVNLFEVSLKEEIKAPVPALGSKKRVGVMPLCFRASANASITGFGV